MGICKENESGTCKPYTCKANCFVGREIRRASEFKKCSGECTWLKTGINSINTCKDPYCSIGEKIIILRKKVLTK